MTPQRDGTARPAPGGANKRQRPNPRPDLKREREADERKKREEKVPRSRDPRITLAPPTLARVFSEYPSGTKIMPPDCTLHSRVVFYTSRKRSTVQKVPFTALPCHIVLRATFSFVIVGISTTISHHHPPHASQ